MQAFHIASCSCELSILLSAVLVLDGSSRYDASVMTDVSDAVQEEAKRTQLHTSAAALEARASRAEQQLAAAQRQADSARTESKQLAARLATVEARLADAQQSQVSGTMSTLCGGGHAAQRQCWAQGWQYTGI